MAAAVVPEVLANTFEITETLAENCWRLRRLEYSGSDCRFERRQRLKEVVDFNAGVFWQLLMT